MMNVGRTLDTIKELGLELIRVPETEKASIYAAARTLIRDLEEQNVALKHDG